MGFPTCACGCGTQLERRGKRGPAKQYASASCRKRAERRRTRERQVVAEFTEPGELEQLPDRVIPAVALPAAGPTDEQVQRAILELRACAFALLRLGAESRPELAWRCTILGQSIISNLKDTFGEELAQ